MANHKSAEKRARQSIKRTARNTQIEKNVKTFEKKLVAAIAAKSKDIENSLREYTAAIMSAVSKGAIKKQTASRKVGRASTAASKAK